MTSHNERILLSGAGKIEMNPPPRLRVLHFIFTYSSIPVRLLKKTFLRAFVLQYSAAISRRNFGEVFILLPLRPCSSAFVC